MDAGAETFSLLLGHLAAGSSLQLGLMARHPVTPGFYRFTGTLMLLLLGTAVFAFPLRGAVQWQAWSLVALVAAVGVLWSRRRGAGPWLFWPAGLLGTVSVVTSAGPYGSWLVSAHFTVSSLVLGAALLGLILGHWYLTEPGLPIAPLRFLSWCFFVSLCARGVLTLQRVPALAAGVSSFYQPGYQLGHAIGSAGGPVGLFIGIRLAVGLLIPLLLAGLILHCVKTRSTMSATGLLYLAMMMVCTGEAVARYLLLARGLLL